MISSRNFAAVGAATRTKKSELLVGGARRRVDRCELFFHVAGDVVNVMVMEGRDDHPSALQYAPVKMRIVTNKRGKTAPSASGLWVKGDCIKENRNAIL